MRLRTEDKRKISEDKKQIYKNYKSKKPLTQNLQTLLTPTQTHDGTRNPETRSTDCQTQTHKFGTLRNRKLENQKTRKLEDQQTKRPEDQRPEDQKSGKLEN